MNIKAEAKDTRFDLVKWLVVAALVVVAVVGDERRALFSAKSDALARGRALLTSLTASPNAARKAGIAVNEDGKLRSAFDLLSYPDVTPADAARLWPEVAEIPGEIVEQLVVDAQYAVYLDRQRDDIDAVRRDEQKPIPDDLDYAAIPGLSMEIRQKLAQYRPHL